MESAVANLLVVCPASLSLASNGQCVLINNAGHTCPEEVLMCLSDFMTSHGQGLHLGVGLQKYTE